MREVREIDTLYYKGEGKRERSIGGRQGGKEKRWELGEREKKETLKG